MRHIPYAFALLLVVMANGIAFATDTGDLYRGRTLVTGMRDETRLPGFTTCLLDVLAKVTGDARLLRDPRAEKMAGGAAGFVIDFTYRDRLEGIPIHDEQGSRDRPYDLTATFDQAKVDAAVQKLDRKPWTDARPRLALFLAVQNGPTLYVLASDGPHGRDQRESLEAVSWQIGMPVVLPDEAALTRVGLDAATLAVADLGKLAALTKSRSEERRVGKECRL